MPGSASTLVVSLTRKSGRPSSVGSVSRTVWFNSWMLTLLDERSIGVAKIISMLEGGVKADKLAFERRGHFPQPDRVCVWSKVAKIQCQ